MDNSLRKVPIKNILHMFSYVWDKVDIAGFKHLASYDDFDSANILSKLFIDNIHSYLKRGIYREYITKTEELKGIKGKINFKESLNNLSFQNAKSVCEYDDLELDNLINQIIKSTAHKLYKMKDLSEENKRELNSLLHKFDKISIIDINKKTFSKVNFNRNNYYTYYFLKICELINNSIMLSEETGEFKFINILDNDEKLRTVFELFVYRFYDKKLSYEVSHATRLNWGFEGGNQSYIPEMRLDILIKKEYEDIIIDTKFYDSFLDSNYGKESYLSKHMYQMFAYMNRLPTEKKIRGILLYPYNGKEISEKYGVKINDKDSIFQIQTIDLSKNWNDIEADLLSII